METREFTLAPAFPKGRERKVTGQRVDIPEGRAAFDLETGKTVQGPATVWQRVKPGESKAVTAAEPKKPGRPKKAAVTAAEPKKPAPPDL